MDNGAAEKAVKALLGDASDPGHVERYASLMHCVDQREALIALKFKNTTSWHAEQYVAAAKYLSPSPDLKARARAIVLHNFAREILAIHAGAFSPSQQEYIFSYGEGLIAWALFDAPDVQTGVQRAISHDQMGPELRWKLFIHLIICELWPLKKLLPALFIEPAFARTRSAIWNANYTLLSDFSAHRASLRALEKPIDDFNAVAPVITADDKPPRLKVAIWSRKLATYNSSMTTVHPWLKLLPADDLEIFFLSDKTLENDPLQNEYRAVYGSNFIDSSNLSDEAFSARARELNLDVIIPIHGDRPHLNMTRLARVHLDVLAQFHVDGFPDETLMSQSMIDERFLEITARKFISIPDPMLIFSPLPDVEIADRTLSDRFRFGVFSRFAKVDSETFDVWAELLTECPLADIEISSFVSSELTYHIARTEFTARGIEPDRILVNKSTRDHAGHLQRYNRVDLMIDTFPMGGAVSAVDSLYMGVPVISLNNDSRPATKVLRSIFAVLDEEAGAVVSSKSEYIAYAKDRYSRGLRDQAQRERLRMTTMQSRLFDHARYADFMRKVIRKAATRPSAQLMRVES